MLHKKISKWLKYFFESVVVSLAIAGIVKFYLYSESIIKSKPIIYAIKDDKVEMIEIGRYKVDEDTVVLYEAKYRGQLYLNLIKK